MGDHIDKQALDNAKGIRPLGFIDMPSIQKGLMRGDEIKVLSHYLDGVINNGVNHIDVGINAPERERIYRMKIIEVSEAYYRVVPKLTVYNSIVKTDRGSFLISRF